MSQYDFRSLCRLAEQRPVGSCGVGRNTSVSAAFGVLAAACQLDTKNWQSGSQDITWGSFARRWRQSFQLASGSLTVSLSSVW